MYWFGWIAVVISAHLIKHSNSVVERLGDSCSIKVSGDKNGDFNSDIFTANITYSRTQDKNTLSNPGHSPSIALFPDWYTKHEVLFVAPEPKWDVNWKFENHLQIKL